MSTEDDPKKVREDDAVPQMAFLKENFGLTPAQSRLVLRLVAGDLLRLSAAALGIGYETARATLKAVFHKTGTCRQAELASRPVRPPPTGVFLSSSSVAGGDVLGMDAARWPPRGPIADARHARPSMAALAKSSRRAS